jgi:serine/threonine protein kinase
MIYKAARMDPGTGEPYVAIKILRPVRAQLEKRAVVRFQREAKQVDGKGKHPNVAPITELGRIPCTELSAELLSKLEWSIPSSYFNLTSAPPNLVSDLVGVKCFNSGRLGRHSVDDCIQKTPEMQLPTGEIHYMVGDYYPDGNLKDWLDKEETIKGWVPDLAMDIAIGLGRGLSWAQASPDALVHRDLNPQNIMMAGAVPKINDWGISSPPDKGSQGIGTRYWSDPKQHHPDYPNADLRYDQYAFGGVLFYIYTAKEPGDPEVQGIGFRQACQKFNPDVPESVLDVIERCRDDDLDKRYPDFEAILEGLGAPPVEIGEFDEYETTLVINDRSTDELKPEFLRRNNPVVWVASFLFLSAIISTALVASLWMDWSGSRTTQILVSPTESAILEIGRVSIGVPAKTVSREAILSGEAVKGDKMPGGLPDGLKLVNQAYDIKLSPRIQDDSRIGGPFTLIKDVSVTFDLDADVFQGVMDGVDTVVIYHHHGVSGDWESLATDVDLESKSATAMTRRFSVFALLTGKQQMRPAPLANLELPITWGYPGERVELSGSGFPPGELIEMITMGGASVMPSSSPRVLEDGRFHAVLVIPDINSGNQELYVSSLGISAKEPFVVLKDSDRPAVAATPSVTASLPPTTLLSVTPTPGYTPWPTPMPTPVPTVTPVPSLLPTYTPWPRPTPTSAPTPLPNPDATLILDDISGYHNDEVIIKGTGFPVGEYIDEMTLGGISVLPRNPVKIKENGNFTATVLVPRLDSGAKDLYVRAEATSAVGRIWVLAPSLILKTIYGYPGDELNVNGSMFTPGGTLDEMTLGGISVMSGPPIIIDEDGSFAASFVVPQLSSGANDLYVYSGDDSSRWSVIVYVLANPPGSAPTSN